MATIALSSSVPSVGTQGRLWLVLFSRRSPGATLFLAWFAWTWWRLRGTGPLDGFPVVLPIAFVQMPFYGWVPVQLHTVMLTAAIGCRALDERLRQSSLEPAEAAPVRM